MSKITSGWPLNFKVKNEMPLVGKFDEIVDFKNAPKPVKMFIKDEDILEEAVDDLIRDSEYYKRRRQRRRSYRPQSIIYLEDSNKREIKGPPKGLQYEGKISNLNLTTEENGVSPAPGQRRQQGQKSVTDVPFKYVLLQVVKSVSDDSGAASTQVNMIPVGDWYAFKKPSVTGQKTLDDLDDDFEAKQRVDKTRMSKYRKISKIMDGGGKGGGKEEDESEETWDAFTLPAAFGKSSMKGVKRGGGGFGGGGGGGGGGAVADAGARSGGDNKLIDESGFDVDEQNEFKEFCGGDYEKTFADDEEEYVGREQAQLEEQEEELQGRELADEVEEPDSDDEDEEDEDALGAGALATTMVDEDMERSAKEYGRLFASAGTGGSTSSNNFAYEKGFKKEAGDSKKRSRQSGLQEAADEGPADAKRRAVDGEQGKQKKKGGVTFSDDADKPAAPAGADKEEPRSGASDEFDMSADGLRRYITSMGGRVGLPALKEVKFRP